VNKSKKTETKNAMLGKKVRRALPCLDERKKLKSLFEIKDVEVRRNEQRKKKKKKG
jgi:hypothetical protein